MNRVVFVGPIPPPLHGFSVINKAMLDKLLVQADDVIFFNRSYGWTRFSPFNKLLKIVVPFFQVFYLFISLIFFRCNSMYMGLSGGLGQLYDLFYVLVARVFRVNIFFHHHSYAYINDASFLAKLIFVAAGDAVHVTLCDKMRISLCENYAIGSNNVLSISNAAFQGNFIPPNISNCLPWKVGFLSNITEEKGIFEFFRTVRMVENSGIAIQGFVAGPISIDVKDRFANELADMSNVKYVGPVYNEEKDAFYRSLHFLVFPTRYVNEAEPVTILESMRLGVPVVAAERGCIAEQLRDGGGLLIRDYSNFAEIFTDFIKNVDSETYHVMSSAASSRFATLHSVANERVNKLVGMIVNG